MKYKWLNKKNNSNLIVFFNGWGMDETVVSHLKFSSYDILMFYDYNDLNCDFDFISTDVYKEKYLVAWSMGVMCATLFADINYNKKIAINGTLKPIDDNFGIPKRIYDLTLRNFSPEGSKKFIKNMFEGDVYIPVINREFDNQKSELFALKEYESNESFSYDKIIISKNDKIIPSKNQSKFWGIEPNIDGGHAPFINFNSWDELL